MRHLLAGLCLIAASAAHAGLALDSQAEAMRVLRLGVQALGPETAMQGLKSVRRDYLEDWVDIGQGARPWSGTPANDTLPAHSGFDDSVAVSFLDYAANRYYESIRYADAPDDYALVVEAGTPAHAFQSITYVRERTFFSEHAAGQRESERLRRFRRFPEGLLRMALDRPETLVSLGTIDEGGARLEAIAFSDLAGTLTRLYFDALTHRLVRSETLRTHGIYGDTTGDVVYSDYRATGPFMLPYSVVTRVGGVPVARLVIRSIEIDAAPQPEWFKPPDRPVDIDASPDVPAVELLGSGVHLIRGAYNLVFAEFRDHVLLVEAPVDEAYTRACLELVAKTVPGKPVRLVSTHFHFDHLGGVRTAVARGIPILTTADAKRVIEQSIASVQVMKPDELARSPRLPTIEVAGSKTVLDDGSQRVELYDFGPTPNAAELLVAYFPAQKLLHVADIFDVLTPELVIAGVDGVVMAERIRSFGLDVERIVPMHGAPVTIEHLRRGLAIRRKYEEPSR